MQQVLENSYPVLSVHLHPSVGSWIFPPLYLDWTFVLPWEQQGEDLGRPAGEKTPPHCWKRRPWAKHELHFISGFYDY